MIRQSVFEGALWVADLDGAVVRGVAGQVQQLAAPLLDQLPHPVRLVCRQLVHDQHLPFFQFGKEDLIQIGFEDFLGGRALDREGWDHPLQGDAR